MAVGIVAFAKWWWDKAFVFIMLRLHSSLSIWITTWPSLLGHLDFNLTVIDVDLVHLPDCFRSSFGLVIKDKGPIILAHHVFYVAEHHKVGL